MPVGRKRPSRVPPGETETWMACASAAAANGAPLNPLSPSISPWKPSAASRGSVGRVPARSSALAGRSSRSSNEPCLSQMTNTFTPLTSLPPSMPRVQALGAERRERLSTTTAEGKTSSPQPKPGPAGEGAVQGGEGNAGEPAGDAPLHAAAGQRPDQPDEAPPQSEVRLASAAVH